jgi:hypothetical protein
MNPLRVFIGFDGREAEAYRVAEASLRKHASVPVTVTPLNVDRLAESGLLRRPTDRRGGIYDLHSNARASTDFHASRFLVPHLAQTGVALFIDCDMVFLADVAELFEQADPQYAVQVVKHQQPQRETMKMDGQAQLHYARKNWSSVCLWNVDHPANRRLSLQDVNERPGRDLHAFFWLHDSEIGNVTRDWNWLVGVQEKPIRPKLAHYTLGTPDMVGDENCAYPNYWREAAR